MRLRLTCLLLLACLPTLCMAQEYTNVFDASAYSQVIEDISLQAGDPLSTQDMMANSQEELASLRERIHTAYQINAESLSGDSKVALSTSQKAWETYVDSTCQVESEREAGSITPVINLSCQVREAQRRLNWLNDDLVEPLAQ